MDESMMVAIEQLEKAISKSNELMEDHIQMQRYVIEVVQANSQELADLRALLAKRGED